MIQIHDVDVLLLLATTLASKRRPAELVDIVAAVDLLQESMPAVGKMSESLARLAVSGLIAAAEGGIQLTPDAEKIMTGQRRKFDTAQRLFAIKEKLAEYNPARQFAPILVSTADLDAAIKAHTASAASAAKNLLVPKPKPAEELKRPGQRLRKPIPSGIRKAIAGRLRAKAKA